MLDREGALQRLPCLNCEGLKAATRYYVRP